MRRQHDSAKDAVSETSAPTAHHEKPTPLGAFASLPIEIRLMIWQAVVFEFPIRVLSDQKTQASCLWRLKSFFCRTSQRYAQFEVLRVSSQISREARCELERYTLCYCLSVSVSHSHTSVETSCYIKGYPDMNHRNLRRNVLTKLGGIRFEINAPQPTTRYGHAFQGATICHRLLWHFLELLAAMEREPRSKTDSIAIREITIAFVNKDNRRWRRTQHGDEDFAHWVGNRYRCHPLSPISSRQGFEWCLEMLLPLEMFKKITVELPEGVIVDECLRRYIRSRSKQDGSKDWVLRTADGKEEILRNNDTVPQLQWQQSHLQ